jgi:hypothetical protein
MKTIFIIGILVSSFLSFAQDMSPLEVVQEQLDAYNSRDINRFAETFADSIVFREFADCENSISGKAQLIERFSRYFDESPELRSNLANRVVFGNKIIDHEVITGSRGRPDPFEVCMVYEVKNGLIIKATAIRNN